MFVEQHRSASDVAKIAVSSIVFLIGVVLAGGLQAWGIY